MKGKQRNDKFIDIYRRLDEVERYSRVKRNSKRA